MTNEDLRTSIEIFQETASLNNMTIEDVFKGCYGLILSSCCQTGVSFEKFKETINILVAHSENSWRLVEKAVKKRDSSSNT